MAEEFLPLTKTETDNDINVMNRVAENYLEQEYALIDIKNSKE